MIIRVTDPKRSILGNMGKRNIDNNQLASFIEYAIEGKVSSSEWNRFAVTHYANPLTENARKECVRVLLRCNTNHGICQEEKAYLYKLVAELRSDA